MMETRGKAAPTAAPGLAPAGKTALGAAGSASRGCPRASAGAYGAFPMAQEFGKMVFPLPGSRGPNGPRSGPQMSGGSPRMRQLPLGASCPKTPAH